MEQFLRDKRYSSWQLIKLFWQSSEKKSAYIFYAAVIAMTIGLVAFDVVFNYWYNFFYDALQEYDKSSAVRLLGLFLVLATVYIILAVYRYYVSQLLGLRWRRWLTEAFIGRWLHKRSYYYLETFDERTDNPDQRIQDDVNLLVNNSLDLSVGLIGSITTFIAFIYILWSLSGVMTFKLGSLGVWHFPGLLVWVALIYALIGTFFTFKLGRPLIALNFEQQRREATFRFAAVDLRVHAENVALFKGEKHQNGILNKLLGGVLQNWYDIILRQKILLWYTNGYNQIAVFLPLVVILPHYFDKLFLLGGVIQSMRAFSSVQDALSFLVNSFPQIAQWRAITRRLTTFVNHMSTMGEKTAHEDKVIYHPNTLNNIQVKNVSIYTPAGEKLLENINENFVHGKHYLIKGRSGIGKSTFIRLLAHIWPYAEGELFLPGHMKTMFLSQNPYMPLGTLAEAMRFPAEQAGNEEARYTKVLHQCHLDHLIPRLNNVEAWSERLSPGELQRIAFARVLLQRPDWVFLDESTSMLDLANEKYFYQLLKEELPHCSMVSVGHRVSLDEFHEHIIDIEKYRPAKEGEPSLVFANS